jgi:hypothetical protein
MPKGKKENLVSLGTRTTDEQRKIASSGGVASGESRRKRKALKDTMNLLLEMPVKDKKQLTRAIKMGFAEADVDNSALVVMALFEKAISGDVPAIRELRDLVDEAGSDTGQLEALIRGLKDDV